MVAPLARADAGRVNTLIREVIEAHREDYVMGDDWHKRGVHALREMLPTTSRDLLDVALIEKRTKIAQLTIEMQDAYDETRRRLGFKKHEKP